MNQYVNKTGVFLSFLCLGRNLQIMHLCPWSCALWSLYFITWWPLSAYIYLYMCMCVHNYQSWLHLLNTTPNNRNMNDPPWSSWGLPVGWASPRPPWVHRPYCAPNTAIKNCDQKSLCFPTLCFDLFVTCVPCNTYSNQVIGVCSPASCWREERW